MARAHNGFRGPGRPPVDGFQARAQVSGAIPSDGFLYARAPRRGKKRKSGGSLLNPTVVAHIDYAVQRMMDALRANPGINVRLPSHIQPPFRATQWAFQQQASPVISVIASSITVQFDGQLVTPGLRQVPDGLLGVMNYFQVTLLNPNQDGVIHPEGAYVYVQKNGLGIPGMQAIVPSYFAFEQVTDIAGSQNVGGNPNLPLIVPVILQAGDRLSFTAVNDSGFQVPTLLVSCGGYFWPVEVQADGISGTVADRGQMLPY